MNQYQQPTQYRQQSTAGAVVRNRVLRNTYMLLAISMIPTVFGAWLALQLGLNQLLSPGMSTIVFFAGAFGLMFLVERNRNSAAGVGFLLLFTFFMGIMLSRMLGFVLSMNDGANLIMLAFGGTAAIFATMATIASTTKRDFSHLHKTLIIGAVVLIVAAIANIFLMIPALTLTISVLAIVIFSAFLLVDIQRIVQGGETNYISATLSVYLSLYNIFVSLLSILGITNND
ncbi:Bax inhibitor-1/YccA family protein [Oligella urethralis]|uniref:Membrane protein n=1 Tax=Oligella urethralis DNF00040 TaxID=1401065 RepID=A0A096AJ03_9BURK|nr:Bax inhibitor-1/YccA family protein [Oligella urethralis]AVL71517.1 BAX inhibitor (BI)-1/YccA family protein [Oligella urethralis]KGF30662.1 membrane protein [Oligella urethralis DNF00040]MDK6202674.1 Bax inhibitor-1/YccA family protein [Oligella urethralis]SUA66626.1 Modulator of FtsH protease YccA [Oligella urethralis]